MERLLKFEARMVFGRGGPVAYTSPWVVPLMHQLSKMTQMWHDVAVVCSVFLHHVE